MLSIRSQQDENFQSQQHASSAPKSKIVWYFVVANNFEPRLSCQILNWFDIIKSPLLPLEILNYPEVGNPCHIWSNVVCQFFFNIQMSKGCVWKITATWTPHSWGFVMLVQNVSGNFKMHIEAHLNTLVCGLNSIKVWP